MFSVIFKNRIQTLIFMPRERIAIIDKHKCKNKVDCPFLCATLCPVNRAGKQCIIEDVDDGKALIVEELCIGCGICIKQCPHLAITIVNLPTTLDHPPVHRFGKNMFELFSLPLPRPQSVLGIMGVNGIGKSTAIKILSKQVMPNLSQFDKTNTYEDIIAYYKGKEEQHLFQKIKDNKLKIAYKPQEVTLISKAYSGTVRELLTKVDERNVFKQVCERFDLMHLMDNNVNEVSGGELQRIAIAATVLKDADVYIFDEPTSFLDVKQRINASIFIKELGEQRSVVVVEHDLLIVDYMADLVQIMFGKAGVFGVVSKPLAARNAINSFMAGYLKEENIRFRDSQIKFELLGTHDQHQGETVVSWKSLKKNYKQFHLSADEGEICKGDVVGVLGENGTGKTTFVKMLAGELKQDEGEIEGKISVAYKPQYLEIEEDMLVMDYLKHVIGEYDRQLVTPLELKPLFMKNLSQLSGGELQRVFIAACLGRDAVLFLLDEPSAYLDIEQRLRVSKIIKDFVYEKGKTCVVVDHDLVFIDYLATKILLFSGNPGRTGHAIGPVSMIDGMNSFLKAINVTVRRDIESKRPRINKPNSVKDREQKLAGNYYYYQ